MQGMSSEPHVFILEILISRIKLAVSNIDDDRGPRASYLVSRMDRN